MEHKTALYSSSLSYMITGFVEEKRAVGYRYNTEASILKRFDNFLIQKGFAGEILTKEMVLLWTEKRLAEADSTRNARISLIKGLAQYMTRLGKKSYVYPEKAVPVNRYRYVSFIFSENELARLFDVVDKLPSSPVSPYRRSIFSLLFRMLYGCGLRVSEILKLKTTDVNLKDGTLFIRHAKLDKERVIPMDKSLVDRCKKYQQCVLKYNSDNSYYFPSPCGGSFDRSTIYSIFRKILWRADISHGGRGRGPRVHDLRWTHAVHCLKKWVLNGKNITALLPYLSAYLGHSDLRGTEYYLKLTADLYPTIIAKVDSSFSNLIPEVGIYETNY